MRSMTLMTATLLLALPLGACAGATRVLTPAVGCSSLFPAGWAEPVPSAAFPADGTDERGWMAFGVQQTGQLVTANGRTSDVIAVVTACEARDAAAVREIERPWWRVWG